MAVMMLAYDRIERRMACDDGNPTHYQNRLTADLGDMLGLNMDDIRRARLDQHASNRFETLRGTMLSEAATRCRELFDVEAMVKAFMGEINSFSAKSPVDSLPRQFLTWAQGRLKEKYIVFDETAMNVEVDESFTIAAIEALFLGEPRSSAEEIFRGHKLCELFLPFREEEKQDQSEVQDSQAKQEHNNVRKTDTPPTAVTNNRAKKHKGGKRH